MLGGCGSTADSDERWDVPLREYVETVRIGAADHPVLAFHRPGVTVAEDGKIYVMESSDGVIKVFDPAGRFLRLVHRGIGLGPGEFIQPGPFRRLGDVFWVYDNALARVTFLDDELNYVDSYQLPQLPSPLRVMLGIPISRDRLVAMVRAPARIPIRGVVYEQLMLAMNRDGTDIDTLAVLPQFPSDHIVFRRNETTVSWAPPSQFRHYPLPGFCPAGRSLAVVERGPAELAKGLYRVTVISTTTGDTAWTRELPVTLTPITPELIERLLSRPFPSGRRLAIPLQEAADSIKVLFSHVSPATAVVVDDRGRVWVAREDLPDSDVIAWDVFADDGSLAFRVKRPRATVPLIMDDKIYSVVRDSLDVPYVVVHEPRALGNAEGVLRGVGP